MLTHLLSCPAPMTPTHLITLHSLALPCSALLYLFSHLLHLLHLSRRDLNGRFFGGRQIAASFFDEERYRRGDLAPDHAECAAWS